MSNPNNLSSASSGELVASRNSFRRPDALLDSDSDGPSPSPSSLGLAGMPLPLGRPHSTHSPTGAVLEAVPLILALDSGGSPPSLEDRSAVVSKSLGGGCESSSWSRHVSSR